MQVPSKQLTTSTYHVAKALVTRGAIRKPIRLALDVHDGVAGRVEHLAATPEESHPKINKRENRAKNYQLDPSVLDGTTLLVPDDKPDHFVFVGKKIGTIKMI